MYRNKEDVISIEGVEVDAGSLWQFKDGVMVLEDSDQYVTHHKTDSFYKL